MVTGDAHRWEDKRHACRGQATKGGIERALASAQACVSREAKKANRDQNPSLTVGKGLGSADSFIVEWGLATK
jgi:hypothetical protein